MAPCVSLCSQGIVHRWESWAQTDKGRAAAIRAKKHALHRAKAKPKGLDADGRRAADAAPPTPKSAAKAAALAHRNARRSSRGLGASEPLPRGNEQTNKQTDSWPGLGCRFRLSLDGLLAVVRGRPIRRL